MQYTLTSERNPSIENDSPEGSIVSRLGDVMPPNERLSEDFPRCSPVPDANIADIRSDDNVPELNRFQSKGITDRHYHPNYFR